MVRIVKRGKTRQPPRMVPKPKHAPKFGSKALFGKGFRPRGTLRDNYSSAAKPKAPAKSQPKMARRSIHGNLKSTVPDLLNKKQLGVIKEVLSRKIVGRDKSKGQDISFGTNIIKPIAVFRNASAAKKIVDALMKKCRDIKAPMNFGVVVHRGKYYILSDNQLEMFKFFIGK